MSVKIAILGAGSLSFTRRLAYDILGVPELRDSRLALHDIDEHNLDMIYRVMERDVRASGIPAGLAACLDRREAIRDADYVISCVRVGGLEAFESDIEIPLKYGVDQCVGDTLCAGGIMYAQRTIPVLLDFCRDIRELAAPGAVFLNYSNPNAMNTWACNKHGGVRTIGLCHGVHAGGLMIARALGADPGDIDYICAGINHQTWFIQVRNKGAPVSGKELLKAMSAAPQYARQEKARLDMLERFGFFTTESNGHVSEYVPWYRKRPDQTKEWISMDSWICGETGGYLRACREGRDWFEQEFPEIMAAPPKPVGEERSHEHGSYIIESLRTGRIYRGHLNVVNHGCISNLPEDCVVEVPCYVDRNGINVPRVGPLPLACAATCSASVRVQEMAVEAAVRGDPLLLKQAMLHDPLTGAVLNPPEIWQLADEMLAAQAKWLPQYRKHVAAARGRLRNHYVKPRGPAADPSTRRKARGRKELAASRREEERLRKSSGAKLDYDHDREVSKGDKY